MLNFAANLTTMFNEVPFLERFNAAREANYKAVEFLFPYEHSPSELRDRIQNNGLKQVLFNLPPGDWTAGERGIGALPGREHEFRASLEIAMNYADAIECRTLHAMAGIAPPDTCEERMFDTFVENLKIACEICAQSNITIVLEPLNSQDVPKYFIPRLSDARRVINAVGCENLGLQFDFYHVQIMDGNLIRNFDTHIDQIRHIQISSVQGRQEPDIGEINYPFILNHINESSYDGWIGCEYVPRNDTIKGLGWLENFR